MAWYNQRADLQIQEIYRAIYKYGYLVRWEKASKCPCLTPDTGQPDINCPLCRGKGRYWEDPQVIRGIMTSFSEELKYNQTGEVISGVSYFTTLPQFKLCNWDRVTNFHSEIRYSEVITHGEHGGQDKLRFRPTSVITVRTVEEKYEPKIDYVFNKEKWVIDWIPTGKEPEVGKRYSVEYKMHPSWIIIDHTNIIRDTYVKSKKPGITFQPLPQRVVVRLEYFVPTPFIGD